MTTIFTPIPIFSRYEPLRALLAERSLKTEWIGKDSGVAEGVADNNAIAGALMARAEEIEFLLVDTTPLRREFFAAAKNLRHVAMFGVGLDHIDMAAATEANVLVTNAPGCNARCVAELVFWFILGLAHKASQMHAGLVGKTWRPRLGIEIHGKVLGIVGLGNIGREVAKLGKALGMRVIFANRTPRPERAGELDAVQKPLEEVLAEADFVTLHIPGGPDSWHFGKKELYGMKRGAYLINAARGDLVDIDELVAAIDSGQLKGAGLDVFPEEPMDFSHPVFSMPQVITTPHAGDLSIEAMQRVATSCLDEVVRILNRRFSPNARNPAVYAAWAESGCAFEAPTPA